VSRPSLEVADIFRGHGPAWRRTNAGHVSLDQLKVMSAIESCRTAALGGHVARCEDCAYTSIAYNSCLMGKSINGELATASAVNLAFFKGFGVDQLPFALHYNGGAPRSTDGRSRSGATKGLRRVSLWIGRGKPATAKNLPAPWIPTRSSKRLRPLGHLHCGNDPLTSARLIAGPRGGP